MRNIVLVTIDSLRADHCGFMGYGKDTTPTLDRMAEEGLVFENAIAPAPFTEDSISAMFTGECPIRDTRDSSLGNTIRSHVARRGSIPQTLSEEGYATAGYSPNPHASRQFGLDKGFDKYRDFLSDRNSPEILRTMFSRFRNGDMVECLRLGANMAGLNIPGFGNQSIPVRAYYDEILDWVSRTTEPFFLWMFPLEVHSPYRPTCRFRGIPFYEMLRLNLVRSSMIDRSPTTEETLKLVRLYDGTIKQIDEVISQLESDLGTFDPVFIVTSDHGEAFNEHGNFGHNNDLYEENIHVPLLVSGIEQSGRISEPISLRKLPEIVSDLTKRSPFEWKHLTGSEVDSRVQKKKIGIRSKCWKYIVSPESSEYYDLSEDPIENHSDASDANQRGVKRSVRLTEDIRERQLIGRTAEELDPEADRL